MHNLFWRYKMSVAVNANLPLMFREGSALGTCTQKLRDFISKVQEIFMKILQTILPCVFGKSKPVVAEVVSTPIPPGAQTVATAEEQVILPPAVAVEPAAVDPAAVEPADDNGWDNIRSGGGYVIFRPVRSHFFIFHKPLNTSIQCSP